MRMEKEHEYAVSVYGQITQLFDSDNENYQYELSNSGVDLTKFFVGILMANKMFYEEVTKDDSKDLIDFISLLNRLTYQYLKEKGKEVTDEE